MLVRLGAGQAAVWWLAIDGVAEVDERRWLALLDPDEAARASRFRFDADRQHFIAAHALTRTMLSRFGDRPAAAWRFVTGSHGKPAVAPPDGDPSLEFNLSHTKGLVACVVARGPAVGIDVESLDRPRLDLKIAEAYFAASEARLVRDAVDPRDAFFRIWTLKEAYIKATGQGLSLALDAFAFTLDPIRLMHAPEPSTPWQFAQSRPTPRHVMALALAGAATVGVTQVATTDL